MVSTMVSFSPCRNPNVPSMIFPSFPGSDWVLYPATRVAAFGRLLGREKTVLFSRFSRSRKLTFTRLIPVTEIGKYA
jgi:hypothetical protein